MIDCKFELNNKPMSTFWCGATQFLAFSGLGAHVNQRLSACVLNAGPIPPGTYYIVDRESGGVLGPLLDRIKGRTNWFALYAIDNRIDDHAYCNEVERGNFRLHPKGPYGISKGCIVINDPAKYSYLRLILKSSKLTPIPGTKHSAYGKVVVR